MNLISRTYKEFVQLNNKNKQPNFKNGQRTWIDISTKTTTKPNGQQALEKNAQYH